MLKPKIHISYLRLSLQFMVFFGSLLLLDNSYAGDLDGALVVDALQINKQPLILTEYFAVLEDPSLTLTLADVQKPDMARRFSAGQLPAAALNLGFTRSAYWLRLNLRNTGARPIDRMLEISYARLSTVQYHHPMSDGTYQSVSTGRSVPFATRPYKNRNFVFPVSLLANSDQVVYLRIQSTDSILVPAKLWEPGAFHTYERNDYIGQAWYFGLATAMILFNLLLFIELRDIVYLLYVNFVIGSAITIAAHNGLAHEFLWPDATLFSNIATFVGVSLTLVILLVFMRTMLNTRTVIPTIDRLLKILMGVHLLAPIAFVISLQTFAPAAALLNLITALLILATGIYCAYKRQRSAYFFVGAFAMIVLGGVITAMRAFGYLPTNIVTINGLQFGSAVEMLLLAFTLADRFNEMRQDKTRVQSELLKAQQRLVENLQTSERMLEARVAERTDELQVINRKLEALSTTDGLTGIANRRCFDEILASEWARAARMVQPLALAMIDIDFFKKYNDHYGHQAGDECLRRIADILSSNVCRTGDLVARYGGEEFVFIAPATDSANALNMAEKVLRALQSIALPHEMSEFNCVTASIGVAVLVPQEGDTPVNLIRSADEAMYRAKQQGRNRVVLA